MKSFLMGAGIAALVLIVGLILVVVLHPNFGAAADNGGMDLGATEVFATTAPPTTIAPETEPPVTEPEPEPEPLTIQEFLHINPVPEGFTVDNDLLPWNLTLLNRYNFLPEDFLPTLAPVGGGHYLDTRIAVSFLNMMDEMRGEGLFPVLISSTRSVAHQRTLFTNQVNRWIDTGQSPEEAFETARRIVAYPGSSEHNLGQAVDIAAEHARGLVAAFGQTPEGIWLAQNSYRFGWVLRYPDHKQHITNIIYEPWHFRYVGIEAANFMFENDVVLEEYVFWRLNQ
ncbi:MAG: M15 family metallopeptidase [Defluviitaleaceae bacterium]|nr:M15 family metallopeptidase [Defluviitaleaceae bacterium]